ncbi:MAG: hypothetical protein L7V87_05715 [Verrucomicrobiales bacterium]|jgi:hypothetical protein|nr:hypothetical protein [Verrucomicrobiales bacterium]
MSLQNSRGRLLGLSRELIRNWQDTQEIWRDQKVREFDQTYMQPLFDSCDNAIAAMEDLDKLLAKLRNDCEIEE